jgi:hypothetical protein
MERIGGATLGGVGITRTTKFKGNDMLPYGSYSSLEELLAGTEYLIEANSFERMHLYNEYKDRGWNGRYIAGYGKQVGTLAGFPVFISLSFTMYKDHLICFYEATSVIVDHDMISKWLQNNTKCGILHGGGVHYYWRTDAMNAHIAFQELDDRFAV